MLDGEGGGDEHRGCVRACVPLSKYSCDLRFRCSFEEVVGGERGGEYTDIS